jgi:hypothetical protein
MTENASQGLVLKTGMVTDQNDMWYVQLVFEMGILNQTISLPLPSVPETARAIKDALLKQYREAVIAQDKETKAKLLLPKLDGTFG